MGKANIVNAQLWNALFTLQRSVVEPFLNRVYNKFVGEVLAEWKKNLSAGAGAGATSSQQVLEQFFIFLNMITKNYLVHYNAGVGGHLVPLLKDFVASRIYRKALVQGFLLELPASLTATPGSQVGSVLAQDCGLLERGLTHFAGAGGATSDSQSTDGSGGAGDLSEFPDLRLANSAVTVLMAKAADSGQGKARDALLDLLAGSDATTMEALFDEDTRMRLTAWLQMVERG